MSRKQRTLLMGETKIIYYVPVYDSFVCPENFDRLFLVRSPKQQHLRSFSAFALQKPAMIT